MRFQIHCLFLELVLLGMIPHGERGGQTQKLVHSPDFFTLCVCPVCRLFEKCFKRWSVLRLQKSQGFPGSPVVENPPASAGETGSAPELRRVHMPRGSSPCAAARLTLRTAAAEPVLSSLSAQSLRSATREATDMRSLHTTPRGQPPARRKQREPLHSNEDPAQPRLIS